jgi:hypothetical protein
VSGISIADRVVSFVFGHNSPLLYSTLVFAAGDVKKARLRLSERQRQDAIAVHSRAGANPRDARLSQFGWERNGCAAHVVFGRDGCGVAWWCRFNNS